MSYPFLFENKEYQEEDKEINEEYYNKLMKSCIKNISKSSFIYFTNNQKKRFKKKVCLIDGNLYSSTKYNKEHWHKIIIKKEKHFRPQTRFNECKGCWAICAECELLLI